MRRREFLGALGSAAAMPFTARAQQGERMRRIGILMGGASADTPESQASMSAFVKELQQLGWAEGSNVRIDTRWATGNPENVRKYARELVGLRPDLILTNGTGTMVPMLQATRSVPVVFVNVADPVGSGFVESLARPGGNVTGFATFEYGVASKWMELLKEISPSVTRAAVIREPANPAGIGQWAIIQTAAPTMGVDVSPINLTDATDIEKALANFARTANAGLIVTPSGAATNYRKLIIALAARHKLPAVYSRKLFVADGGLMSYGIDVTRQFRQAAGYVDRILRGETPADLPAQAPTKYELVVNLKTAKALGLTVPAQLLARADEVIE